MQPVPVPVSGGRGPSTDLVIGSALAAAVVGAFVLLASQRRRQRWELPEDMLDEPVMAPPPYDHELEDVLVH